MGSYMSSSSYVSPSFMPPGSSMSNPADPETAAHPAARATFVPSPVDVLVVKTMLVKAAALPFELANRIIEFAEYWTCSHTAITYKEAKRFGPDSNKLLVGHLPPLPLALLPPSSD